MHCIFCSAHSIVGGLSQCSKITQKICQFLKEEKALVPSGLFGKIMAFLITDTADTDV